MALMADEVEPRLPFGNDGGPLDQGEAYARRTDPHTSHEAAAQVDAKGLQRAALRALSGIGGCGTNSAIVEQSGLDWRSITPRMAPLRRKGLVVEIGTQPGDRGRQQIVWQLTALGRAVLDAEEEASPQRHA